MRYILVYCVKCWSNVGPALKQHCLNVRNKITSAGDPTNTKHWDNGGSILGHRLCSHMELCLAAATYIKLFQVGGNFSICLI